LTRSTRNRLALLSALVLAAGAASESIARVAADNLTFQDATGEDPGGFDITTVVVSNNQERLITFIVNVPSRPTFTEDMRVRVWLDSDYNRDTGLTVGDRAGSDYFFLWDREGVRLFRCSGSSCRGGASPKVLGSSYRFGAKFTISAYDLKTKRFRFAAEAAAGLRYDAATRRFDVTNARWDYAPEQGQFWSYDVRLAPSTLLVKSFSTTPARPKAGKTFSVRLAATRADTGAVLSSGQVTCLARIGGRSLKPRSQRFSHEKATCVFALPARAKGRTIRGSITIVSEGRKIAKAFSRKIR
jgi:hypothetical protein